MSSSSFSHGARPATGETSVGDREPVPTAPPARSTSRSTRLVALLLAFVVLAGFAACDEPGGDPGTRNRNSSGEGIWISEAELARLPTSGPAWDGVVEAANSAGPANLADQDSNGDVNAMAAGLVYARTGDNAYRTKAAQAVMGAVGTESGGRTLALGRNLVSYVIAADLIDLASFDSGMEGRFRSWLGRVRSTTVDGKTLIETHEGRPNNWGTHAGASRAAIAAYLGDRAELNRVNQVFTGWTGDRGAYAGFDYGELSWQANPASPVGVNPAGASREGVDIGGALPEEMRRGGGLSANPGSTGYPWGGIEGAVVTAQILERQGYDAFGSGNQALRRSVQFLADLDAREGGWWVSGDDEYVPWMINKAYGTRFPVSAEIGEGKNMGFTNWTHSR